MLIWNKSPVLNLYLTYELYKNEFRPLKHLCYIYSKKAFDSVIRTDIWNILNKAYVSAPNRLI